MQMLSILQSSAAIVLLGLLVWSSQQLKQYLKDAGFTHIAVYADRVFEAPRPGEQRIYIKARKGKRK